MDEEHTRPFDEVLWQQIEDVLTSAGVELPDEPQLPCIYQLTDFAALVFEHVSNEVMRQFPATVSVGQARADSTKVGLLYAVGAVLAYSAIRPSALEAVLSSMDEDMRRAAVSFILAHFGDHDSGALALC